MTRFLCVGDLHLGAGSDYGREPGDRLRDQERVWQRALELAAEHDVDAVLFAGDAFHRRRPTPSELLAFQRPVHWLRNEAPTIDVLAICGNHDCEAADLPTALDVFGRDVDLRSTPGVWETRGAAVACLPWTPVSRLVASRDGGDRDELHGEAAGLLVAAARGLRAEIPAGRPAVLLLHWSVSGASTPTGVLTDDFREPVLDVDELAALGFDAVVAGHIHRAQLLGDKDLSAPMFYTGSPAPVDFGEASVAHGCWLLDRDRDPMLEFLPIASRPFVTHDFDLTTHDGIFDLASLTDVRDAVVRVRYRATEDQARRFDHSDWRRELYEQGAHKVFAIQPDIVREQRSRVDGMDEDLAPLAAVDAWVSANEIPTSQSAQLVDLTSRYLETVPA